MVKFREQKNTLEIKETQIKTPEMPFFLAYQINRALNAQ